LQQRLARPALAAATQQQAGPQDIQAGEPQRRQIALGFPFDPRIKHRRPGIGTDGADHNEVLDTRSSGSLREVEHGIVIDRVKRSAGARGGHGRAKRAECHSSGRQHRWDAEIGSDRRGNTLYIAASYRRQRIVGFPGKPDEFLPDEPCRACQNACHRKSFSPTLAVDDVVVEN
jgi:hypothetical protein